MVSNITRESIDPGAANWNVPLEEQLNELYSTANNTIDAVTDNSTSINNLNGLITEHEDSTGGYKHNTSELYLPSNLSSTIDLEQANHGLSSVLEHIYNDNKAENIGVSAYLSEMMSLPEESKNIEHALRHLLASDINLDNAPANCSASSEDGHIKAIMPKHNDDRVSGYFVVDFYKFDGNYDVFVSRSTAEVLEPRQGKEEFEAGFLQPSNATSAYVFFQYTIYDRRSPSSMVTVEELTPFELAEINITNPMVRNIALEVIKNMDIHQDIETVKDSENIDHELVTKTRLVLREQ